ncbi:MAG: GPI anchored serine-threonine rich family protein [Bacteroidetes bacterium]|nr:GPI anchored serine-threonine rich family protein [Bacteroidota bacterium]
MKCKLYNVVISALIFIALFTGCRQLLEGANDPGIITTDFEPVEKIIVTSPVRGDIYAPGDLIEIKWLTSFSSVSKLNIFLYRKSVLQRTIIKATQNTGSYFWQIPDTIDNSVHYSIKVVSSNNPEEFNSSGSFGILNNN